MQTYNIATASDLFVFIPDHSDALHGIYQTRYGALAVVDNDGGPVVEFGPLSDEDALAEVPRYRPKLADRFFGPFPEGGASERRLTIRVPGNLADRIEAAAKAKDLLLDGYALRCFEQFIRLGDADRVIGGCRGMYCNDRGALPRPDGDAKVTV